MGDGRDGLSEAVHLAAEKSRLAAEVTALRIALTIEQDRVKQLSDEVERQAQVIRDLMATNNEHYDEVERLTHDLHEARLHPMADDVAEVERLQRQLLDTPPTEGR